MCNGEGSEKLRSRICVIIFIVIPKNRTQGSVLVLATCDGAVEPVALETRKTLTRVGSRHVGAVGMTMTRVLHTLINIWKKGKKTCSVAVKFLRAIPHKNLELTCFSTAFLTDCETNLDTLDRHPQILVNRSRQKPIHRCSCSRLAGERHSRGFRLGSGLLDGSPLQNQNTR